MMEVDRSVGPIVRWGRMAIAMASCSSMLAAADGQTNAMTGLGGRVCIFVEVDPLAYRPHPDISGIALSQVEGDVGRVLRAEMAKLLAGERVQTDDISGSYHIESYPEETEYSPRWQLHCDKAEAVVHYHILSAGTQHLTVKFDVVRAGVSRSRAYTYAARYILGPEPGPNDPDTFGGFYPHLSEQAAALIEMIREMGNEH